MKSLQVFLILALLLSPLVFSASDCEHSCCTKFSGSWDDDFDDCKHPKTGFDTCLSDCEASVWAARPQGPAVDENTPSYHVNCTPTFVLVSLVAGAAILRVWKN